jgi:hypothetical protein
MRWIRGAHCDSQPSMSLVEGRGVGHGGRVREKHRARSATYQGLRDLAGGPAHLDPLTAIQEILDTYNAFFDDCDLLLTSPGRAAGGRPALELTPSSGARPARRRGLKAQLAVLAAFW